MNFDWLVKRIFIDKRARDRIKSSRKTNRKAAATPEPEKDAAAEDREARKKLIRETMALYREKRVEYEKLDGELRSKIDKAAREAFGGKKE